MPALLACMLAVGVSCARPAQTTARPPSPEAAHSVSSSIPKASNGSLSAPVPALSLPPAPSQAACPAGGRKSGTTGCCCCCLCAPSPLLPLQLPVTALLVLLKASIAVVVVRAFSQAACQGLNRAPLLAMTSTNSS